MATSQMEYNFRKGRTENGPGINIINERLKFIITLVLCLIDKLMDHEEERRQDLNEWKMFQKDVVDIIRQHKDVDDDQIHHLIGLLSINCVGVRFKKDKKEGRALYPLAIHCVP